MKCDLPARLCKISKKKEPLVSQLGRDVPYQELKRKDGEFNA
jgi:hypothetical protein